MTDPTSDRRAFRDDVLAGLRRPPRTLPCKYFYDAQGARLFEEICRLDEYYLTRTETAVLRAHADDMARRLGSRCVLVEFGSGSGRKTRLLLDRLERPACYVPVDVSRESLDAAAAECARHHPALPVHPLCADFTRPLELPPLDGPRGRTAVFFPGSTVGNFSPPEAAGLLRHIAGLIGRDGGLLIGVDLPKSPDILEPAYDDSRGVTAAFNRNVLARINRELGGDFDLQRFGHRALFNPAESRIEMHLVSLADQTVRVAGVEFTFRQGESIHTENSYKYSLDQFRGIADEAGLTVQHVWLDPQEWFSVQYLTPSRRTDF